MDRIYWINWIGSRISGIPAILLILSDLVFSTRHWSLITFPIPLRTSATTGGDDIMERCRLKKSEEPVCGN
jgi:hypothetical protein